MAETERILLNHYKLPSLFPAEWPAEKDESDASSDDEEAKNKPLPRVPSTNLRSSKSKRMSRSRFSVLERSASRAGTVPGTQKTKDGVENMVQKDEADPLGMTASVVNALRRRGLPVEDDPSYREA
jgi:exocyst complex component 2